jgi:mono/diheme cytochrome c family protein
MPTRIVAALAVVALVAFGSTVAAQGKPKVERTPVQPTSATDAAGMFQSYCAACHGKEGKGNGPAAKALTKTPADLTQLSAKNGGKFPEIEVSRYIEGADEVPAHGNRDMPVWGDLLRYAGGGRGLIPLRVKALTEYIKTLQK